MKKTLLLIASAAMLLVGCAKEKLGPEAGAAGEMVTANFTAHMQGLPEVKSVTDGQGTKANRCVMEIYYKGVLYTRDVQPISSMKATFTPKLVSNRTYDVLFWADCGDGLADKYYTTDAEGLGLQAVEMKATAYTANDDARDAFYTTESVEVLQQVSTEEFELTRPFAQVNIITTDAADIKNDNLYPDGVKMVYKAPTKFNLLTETLSEEKELTVTGTPYETFDKTSAALTLEMDYLFASSLEQSALDIAFEASKTGETSVTSHSFTNIPVKRNFRTNIKGALITTTGDWTATIVPGWNQPDEEVKFVEAGSVAAANEAFANGATSVKITSVGEETNLYLPQTTKEVTIDFANPSEVVTVKYGPAPVASPATKAAVADKPAVVNIATNDVTKFVVTGISNLVWLAGNQAALASALNNAAATHTVALSNDITMSENWISVSRGSNTPNFDGRNHAIINMTITTQEESYVGLFSTIENHVVLQNVTFKDVQILVPASIGDNARGGVLVGHMYPSDVVNCHVEGATIKAHQKMGGLIGYVEGDAANKTISIKDCSVKDITLSSNVQGSKTVAGVGGLIGHLVLSQADLITVENNLVENITITDSKPIIGVYNYDDYGQYLPHVFIGNACQNYKGEEAATESKHSILFANNRILGTNTELSTCIYSSEYFGWGGNAEDNPTWKGKIYIDGEAWTPNYPFKNVTKGVGYPTLAAAVADASTGDEIDITAAGTYTVPVISKNIIITGAAEGGVVFNCVGSGSIASISNGATFKNVTMNFGQSGYHGFQHAGHIVMESCVLNGLFFSYGDMTFNECIFNQDKEEYNMWTYAGDITYNGCSFNSVGKFLNIFRESAIEYDIVAKDCVFNTSKKNKAALNIKETSGANFLKYNVTITNCSCNDLQNTLENAQTETLYRVSPIWQVDDMKEGDAAITVTVDGQKQFPATNFKVSTVDALESAIKMFNSGKEKVEYTIELADGTYEVSDLLIRKNVSGKSLVMKAVNPKGATLKVGAVGEKHYIFKFDGCSSYDETRTTSFEGINFDLSAISGETAVAQSMSGNEHRYGAGIIFDGCDLTGGNSMNLNAMYFSSPNHSSPNVVIKNCSIANVGYLASCYAGEFVAENVTTTTNVKHFINNQTSGITTVKDCVVNCNTDYAIRSNGGSISITGSTFNMTYEGSDIGGIFVNRRPDAQLTMTGNTLPALYVGTNMHDIYNDPDDGHGGNLILNDGSGTAKTITTEDNMNYYDFPRE